MSILQYSKNLTITPSCPSSAISFSPPSIVFLNYASTDEIFNISAANGLSGNFEVTFTKVEGDYIFYTDIKAITVNVYVPTFKYLIRINSFVMKSIEVPLTATISLEVPTPSEFALITTSNCSSGFVC